ncbi:MAG: ABC transporter substrate-binding protein [Chthonomonadales bacterium]
MPVACGRLNSNQSVTLTIWSSPTHIEEENFLKLCRRFEKEHPNILIHNVGGLQEPKLIRALVAGVPPDLLYMYNPTLVGPLAGNGALQPLDDRFKRSGFTEEIFLPGAIKQLTMFGKLYAMPICRDCRAFFWNKKCFRDVGLDPDAAPKTMEELMQFAVKLTKKSPDGRLLRLGMQPPQDNALFLSAMGGQIWDDAAHKLTIDCKENVAALEFLVKLVDAEGGHDAVAAYASGFGATESAQNPLATGSMAMCIDGEWLALYLEKYSPTTDYGIGLIPYPAARPDLKNMAWQDGDVLMLPVGSKHPDEAWSFMQWIQAPAQQEDYAATNSNLPTIQSLVTSSRLTSGSRSKEALGFMMSKIATNRANTRFFPSLPVTRLCKDALDNAVQMAELHRKSPQEALHDAQVRVERELKKYDVAGPQ